MSKTKSKKFSLTENSITIISSQDKCVIVSPKEIASLEVGREGNFITLKNGEKFQLQESDLKRIGVSMTLKERRIEPTPRDAVN